MSLLFNVCTDYLSLFVIRPVLIRSGTKPVIGLALGAVSGAAIVYAANALRIPLLVLYVCTFIHGQSLRVCILNIDWSVYIHVTPPARLIYAWPALAVFAWLPLFALGILIARLLTPLTWIVGRTQWFLKEGKEHPLKAIGYVAAVVVFLGTVEWLGEFRNDLAAYIDLETIEAAVDRGVTVRPPRRDAKPFAFLDPSGGMRDSFTCAVATRENDGTVVLDSLIEVRAPFNPTQATEQISAALKERGITTAQSDKYGAAWITDAFSKCGITVRHSDRDRSQIYLDCLPLFMAGRVRLLDNKRLVSQFAALERRTSPVGKDRIDHGPGGHDDLCNSAAGALVLAAAQQRRGGLMFVGAASGPLYVDDGDGGVRVIPDHEAWSPATGGVT
jgi:hypothetical protein